MYRAKNAGKAQYALFDQQMHAAAKARLQMENDLRRALERREFQVLYQPILTLPEQGIIGFEALLRWNHPDGNVLLPDQFLAIAEESGLIIPIGRWVLADACRQLQRWNSQCSQGGRWCINVNVSRRQMLEPGLLADIDTTLTQFGIRAQQLNLEITESAIMKDLEIVTDRLAQLKKLGVGLHMDDFGTGYSSLSCLHRFPLDVGKIDRSFTAAMGADRAYAAVIRAIVTLAHGLNMQVTVEGVETQEQLDHILAIECDFAQGYFFSHPIDGKAAERLLRNPHTLRAAKKPALTT